MSKILLISYRMYCGRMGELEGKCLIRENTWDDLQGYKWYASDVLGKYSEFYGVIGEDDSDNWTIKEITDEQLTCLEEVFDFVMSNYFHLSGFTPIGYLSDDDEDEEDEEDDE